MEPAKEAARYRRVARAYAREAREASVPADKNIYSLLAEGYMRLAKAYDEEAVAEVAQRPFSPEETFP